MPSPDAIVVHGAAESAEVIEDGYEETCPKCGRRLTITAGMVSDGKSIKVFGSQQALTCSCGAPIK